MMPSCKSMDSYPYQRNQMQFPPYYFPNIEANPSPQIKMEPPKPPFPYEQPWPYAGNYGHPMQFCCGHNNFPGCFSYKPPYHHQAPVPSPMYYPAYGEPFFVPYWPQPHYSMDLPRYEFDKYMPIDYHCCGCPNYRYHQNGPKGSVKIEEEESDLGKKVKDADALVPVQMRNYPYPIVWIPPEYTTNKEVKNDAPIADERKSWSARNFRADAEEPRERWNGWIPIDMSRMPSTVHKGDGRRRSQNLQNENNSMKESEDGRMNHNSQSDQKRSEFQFPIIWMPYNNKQEEENGRKNSHDIFSTPKCVEEVPYSFNSVHVNPKSDEGVRTGTRSDQVESKKVHNEKIIPVKELELHQGKTDSEEKKNVTKKDSPREKLSTIPQKNGKLPPVCLRVDPLPRKKNGNGNSRSPSPPALKEQSKETIGERSKAPSGGDSNEQNESNIGKEVKSKETTIAVSETKTEDKAPSDSLNYKAYSDSSLQNVQIISEKVEPKERTIQVNENKTIDENKEAKEIILVCEKEEKMAEKGAKHIAEEGDGMEKKVLSDADAAVLIQAAYRGYQVRRWEPLKKLKQIDEVSEELTNVRDCVEALENSSDLQNDEKQRIAIGETIMRLLLKLDTIQGLHSSFREIRKSLARELTSLQERLDSIMVKKPQQRTQEFAAMKPVEETAMNTRNEECIQEQQEENDAVPIEDSVEGINDDKVEKCEYQSQLLVDSTPNETVDECNLASRELPVGVIDEDVTDHSSKKDEQNDSAFRELDSASNGEDSDINPMRELPVGVIDDDIDTSSSEFGKNDGSKNSNEEPRIEDVESLVELPVRVLDEDTVKPEFENHIDETETSKVVEARNCNVDEDSSFQLQQKLVEEKEDAQSSGEAKNEAELLNFTAQANDEESMVVNEVKNIQPEPVTGIEDQDIVAEMAAASHVSEHDKCLNGGDKRLMEENEKLREMLKKLLEAGNEQMNVITDLTGRVKDLEKRLARSKRFKTKRFKPATSMTQFIT